MNVAFLNTFWSGADDTAIGKLVPVLNNPKWKVVPPSSGSPGLMEQSEFCSYKSKSSGKPE